MSSRTAGTAGLLCCLALVMVVALLTQRSGAAGGEPPTFPPIRTAIRNWQQGSPHKGDWGEMRTYFYGQTQATTEVLAAVTVLQPGKAPHGAHRHGCEEYLMITEGEGVWLLDGKEIPAKKGDMLYTEPWVFHGIRNTGDKPLTMVVFKYTGKGVKAPPRPADGKPDEP